MDTNSDRQAEAQVVRDHILSLLGDLPLESLNVVNQFVQFLHERARQGQPVVSKSDDEDKSPYFYYPSVGVPAKSLDGLIGLLSEGYEGDALADTEALYDEA
jgi:hypothetical protein